MRNGKSQGSQGGGWPTTVGTWSCLPPGVHDAGAEIDSTKGDVPPVH